MYGVLDRIEDQDLAVILIEEKKKEIILPLDRLPPNSKEGTWFRMSKEDGTYKVLAIDEEKTKQQEIRSADLLAQLRARSTGSKYKKGDT